MLVWIVVATLPDNSGMDVGRMEKVEDMPDEVARIWLNSGGARKPTDAEIAAYRGEQPPPDPDDPDKAVDGPKPVADEPYTVVPAEQVEQPDEHLAEKPGRRKSGDQPPAETPAE